MNYDLLHEFVMFISLQLFLWFFLKSVSHLQLFYLQSCLQTNMQMLF